jgi:perosamine synthetase
MHTFGHPVRIEKIAELCKKYNITLIEDAAESLGSFYKGKHTGHFWFVRNTLSFNGNKTITTGGGGMIITNEKKIAELAKAFNYTSKSTS